MSLVANTKLQPAIENGEGHSTAEIRKVIDKAEKGDRLAMVELREILKLPGQADILGGNIARESLRLIVNNTCGNDPVILEATKRKLDEMRMELLGQNPTALERLLVERIIATWYHLHRLEAAYSSKESLPLKLGMHYQKCITAAQKRYFAAIRGLADVRKMALPTLQLNFAKQQINISTTTNAK